MMKEQPTPPKVYAERVRTLTRKGSDYWGVNLADLRALVAAADEASMSDDALISYEKRREHFSRTEEYLPAQIIVREIAAVEE